MPDTEMKPPGSPKPPGEAMELKLVYPNVSQLNRRGSRGGLDERSKLARQTGCRYVEVPADFIKNQSEVNRTGLSVGSFLDESAIGRLYEPTRSEKCLGYILHTEPMRRRQVKLAWHDTQWRKKLVQMLLNLCDYLGYPASFIEIHPGGRGNSNENLLCACREILEAFEKEYSSTLIILLENRTKQFISTGRHLNSFWKYLKEKHADLETHVGIVLDVQQLFTATGKRFIQELDLIPREAIKGLHIHRKHGPPSLADPIPWRYVFEHLREILPQALLNPEIHHRDDVPVAIQFCLERIQELQQGLAAIDMTGNLQRQEPERQPRFFRGRSMNSQNIKKEHIRQAAAQIDVSVISPKRKSKKKDAIVEGRGYPPVYLVEVAYKIAQGRKRRFRAQEALNLLRNLGIQIEEKTKIPPP